MVLINYRPGIARFTINYYLFLYQSNLFLNLFWRIKYNLSNDGGDLMRHQ